MRAALPFFLLSSTLAYSSPSQADQPDPSPAHFDRDTPAADSIHFVEDLATLRPRLSLFRLSEQRFLSSGAGERYALITVENVKSSATSLDRQDVVGILANGRRLHPVRIEGDPRIHQRGSVLLHFGIQKFPLIRVETRY